MTGFWSWLVAGAAMAVGALVATIFFRVRAHAILEAAVGHGRAGLQSEIAAQAQVRQDLETQLLLTRQDSLRYARDAQGLRQKIDALVQDRARLAQRSSRLPELEAERTRLLLQLRMAQEELRRLATSEAEKAQALAFLHEQMRGWTTDEARLERIVRPIQAELDALRLRLDSALAAGPGSRS